MIEKSMPKIASRADEIKGALSAAPSRDQVVKANAAAKAGQEAFLKGEAGREHLRYRPLNSVLFKDFNEMRQTVSAMYGETGLVALNRSLESVEMMDGRAKKMGYDTEIGLTVTRLENGGWFISPYLRVLLGHVDLTDRDDVAKVKADWTELKKEPDLTEQAIDGERRLKQALKDLPVRKVVEAAAEEAQRVISRYLKGKLSKEDVRRAMNFEYPNAVYFSNAAVLRASLARFAPGRQALALIDEMIAREIERDLQAKDLGLKTGFGVNFVRERDGGVTMRFFVKCFVSVDEMEKTELARIRKKVALAPMRPSSIDKRIAAGGDDR